MLQFGTGYRRVGTAGLFINDGGELAVDPASIQQEVASGPFGNTQVVGEYIEGDLEGDIEGDIEGDGEVGTVFTLGDGRQVYLADADIGARRRRGGQRPQAQQRQVGSDGLPAGWVPDAFALNCTFTGGGAGVHVTLAANTLVLPFNCIIRDLLVFYDDTTVTGALTSLVYGREPIVLNTELAFGTFGTTNTKRYRWPKKVIPVSQTLTLGGYGIAEAGAQTVTFQFEVLRPQAKSC